MPHVLGNAGGPPPATRNETLLREAVDRLRRELDAARKVIGPAAAIYQDGNYDPVLFAELGAALDAYDKVTGEAHHG